MSLSILGLMVCINLLFGNTQGCFKCFYNDTFRDAFCAHFVNQEFNTTNPLECFVMLDTIFNGNIKVIESAKVGAGYDKQLRDIMHALIQPLFQQFLQKLFYDFVYKQMLQSAADNFVAAVSQLPRVSECYPPCGFQIAAAEYDCRTCIYDSCGYPLDCPVKNMKVMENSRSSMSCQVNFTLPSDLRAVWSFAEKLNTTLLNQFIEVTTGVDMLFSIPITTIEHWGTYQCEIYTQQRSIVRLYYYISVTLQDEKDVGHTELQDIFDLALLPSGSMLLEAPLLPTPKPYSPSRPSAVLLGACAGAVLLLLLISLWTLYWVVNIREKM